MFITGLLSSQHVVMYYISAGIY